MVQRTLKAVPAPVNESDMLHTTDVVLYSLIRYLLQHGACVQTKNSMLFDSSEYLIHMFKLYFPYFLNYMHDMSVCFLLLSNCILISKFSSVIYILTIRSNYSTDIITRNNVSFSSLGDHDSNILYRRIYVNYDNV